MKPTSSYDMKDSKQNLFFVNVNIKGREKKRNFSKKQKKKIIQKL
jgi:hypothetical protein